MPHGLIRHGISHVLVHLEGTAPDDAIWERLDEFVQHYPQFQLKDELLDKEGRDVMLGMTYSHRQPGPMAVETAEKAQADLEEAPHPDKDLGWFPLLIVYIQ